MGTGRRAKFTGKNSTHRCGGKGGSLSLFFRKRVYPCHVETAKQNFSLSAVVGSMTRPKAEIV